MLFHESEEILSNTIPSGDKNFNAEMTQGGARLEHRPGQI
jgi:hypothetical protein